MPSGLCLDELTHDYVFMGACVKRWFPRRMFILTPDEFTSVFLIGGVPLQEVCIPTKPRDTPVLQADSEVDSFGVNITPRFRFGGIDRPRGAASRNSEEITGFISYGQFGNFMRRGLPANSQRQARRRRSVSRR